MLFIKVIIMIPFSILDLCPILQNGTIAQAFQDSVKLSQLAEKLDFKRYWIAEHHNMPGIASAASSLIISHIASATNHMRIGSGGIMLPNHSPLVIAEQFGTLATLYGERIDLGIGRAPGTDHLTAKALRRHLDTDLESFPDDVIELQMLLSPKHPNQKLIAIPGEGTEVPIWLLGSSLYSAELAAHLGMPYAFASHFTADYLLTALALYQNQFRPSSKQAKPYSMAGVVVIVADTDDEAHYLFSSMVQQTAAIHKGASIPLPPPSKKYLIDSLANSSVEHSLSEAIIGSPQTVKKKLQSFITKTKIDELMITSRIYDEAARLYSFTKIAEIRRAL